VSAATRNFSESLMFCRQKTSAPETECAIIINLESLDGTVCLTAPCQTSIIAIINSSSSSRRRRRWIRRATEECAQLRTKLFASDQVDVEVVCKNKLRQSKDEFTDRIPKPFVSISICP